MSDSFFTGKTVLITGGTGSFGQALARRLLKDDLCHKVIIFSRDEWKQWKMREQEKIFSHPKIRYFIGDVRDKIRLKRAFNEVDLVVHAAALKQVPAAEYNPSEFVKTNVDGGQNVIDAAIDSGVKKVIALSTDKAVNPVNLYGATKLCSDKLFVAGNSYVGAKGYPQFSVVRYGNVLGSRGSLIELWRHLVAEGRETLPVTDEQMSRFWITLDQAVEFVMKSAEVARGGEIFVPKIPSMRVMELAKAVCPDMPIEIIGIRPGEKLHELMIPQECSRHTREYETHYMIMPDWIAAKAHLKDEFLQGREGKFVPEDFAYTSDGNDQWLSIDDVKKLI